MDTHKCTPNAKDYYLKKLHTTISLRARGSDYEARHVAFSSFRKRKGPT